MSLGVDHGRVSGRRLAELREETSGRDLAILRQIAELRFMTSRQVEAIHFTGDGRSTLAAARAARRHLERLTSERFLVRLERRIGGIRAGSAASVYVIGPVGQRLLELPGARRRHREPSRAFLTHGLSISQLVTDLTVAARSGPLDLLGLQAEPHCWRSMSGAGGAVSTLRPDLFVAVGKADTEYRWFVEVDLGSEHLPTLLRKCTAYEAYYRSGREQAEHGVFPRVLWLMHTPTRVARLQSAIDRDGRLTPGLFVVTTQGSAVDVAVGGTP
jgi:hypothetical protein